jgi:hypothetical protein
MRLLLVSPSNRPGRKVPKAIRMPQLGLHIIASLTPEDIAVTVVDEQIREIDFSQEFAEGHQYVQRQFYSFPSILRHIPSLLSVSPVNLRRALVFLLLNFAGKHVAKYIDTSLDWADSREKWDCPQARPNQVVKTSVAPSM